MRLKVEAILEFGVNDERQPHKIVREYRNEYKVLGGILDNSRSVPLAQGTGGRGQGAGSRSKGNLGETLDFDG